jgi:ribosomal protein S18 acetylase RimI-like enzyme
VGDLILRGATHADAAAVLDFWQAAAEDSHRPADTPEAILRLVDRDPDALLLAVEGTEIVGSLVMGWDGWRCHLYRLAVRPDRRRRGIAGRLLGAAEERFRAYGASRIDAMVLDGNDSAHEVWARTGFRRQAEWSRWIKPLDG